MIPIATISSTLKLNDQMSKTFSSITKAMKSTLSAVSSIEGADLGKEFAQASADVKLAEKAIEQMNEELQKVPDATKKAEGGFTVMKGAIANLVASGINVAISALKQFASEMVNVAATVQAENSMFEQTFADMGDEASAAIMRVADASGILETRLNVAGSRIYSFARSSGATTSDAMTLMETALQAAADSAAYYDKSLEETTDTMMSFLKGNYANDAALGVSATEYTRNAKATELFGKEYSKLSEIQKQQTLLKMVTDSQALSGAMGQAAREADGWENVMGNLNEAWRQFQAEVGAPFLKALIPIVKSIANGITVLKDNLSKVAPVLAGIAAGIAGAAIALGIYTVAQWIATGAATAFFAALLANPLTWIALVIGVVVMLIYKWIQSVGGLQIAWAIVMDYLLFAWDTLQIAFMLCVDIMLTKWDDLQIGFLTGVYYVQDLFDKLNIAVARVVVAIANKMGDMKVDVLTILQDMVNGAIGIINELINSVSSVLDIGIEAIAEVTFATTAAAENEAYKAQSNATLESYIGEINDNIAGREADLAARRAQADADREERWANMLNMAGDALDSQAERRAKIADMQSKNDSATDKAIKGIETTLDDLTSGSGSGSALKTTGDVNISGEDIKMLLDLATMDYRDVTYQVLTPQLSLNIDTIRENVDVDYVIQEISTVLTEAAESRVVTA